MIGRTNTGGGGGSGGLNFKVVGYATEAELLADTPKENTIGIITTNKITGWMFSATEPESPAKGMVWISTGASSDVEFNALKKNGIQVYPLSAKQYVSGAWGDVTAMSYQGGEWVELITPVALFWHGDECISTTGGWQLVKQENQIGGTVTVSGSELVVNGTSADVAAIAMCRTFNGSLLNGKNYVRVLVSDLAIRTDGVCYIRIFKSLIDTTKLAEVRVTASGEYSIPLYGVTSGQVAIVAYMSTVKATEIEVA